MKFLSIEERKYHHDDILVSTDWLESNLKDPSLVILDLDSSDDYSNGHIEGSINVIDNYFKTSLDDRTHVQTSSQISETFSKLGISNSSTVFGYDRSSCLYSFRLAWVLNFYGHSNVKVLDGGLPKWVHEKKKIVTDNSKSPLSGNFVPSDPIEEIFADKEKILEIVNGKKGYQILDVRSDDERNGINLRGGDRGGYIPSSVHKEWVNFNTSGDVPILKSSSEILEIAKSLELDPAIPTITYCQGGIRAAHVFWSLRLAGFKEVMNYDASWREWGTDHSCPIIDMT